ncbi:MAG: tandem-95 repeat protein [Gemmataceae bacterium]|nr:tandem-95 repeat protein [Gemmataceae bacterium]
MSAALGGSLLNPLADILGVIPERTEPRDEIAPALGSVIRLTAGPSFPSLSPQAPRPTVVGPESVGLEMDNLGTVRLAGPTDDLLFIFSEPAHCIPTAGAAAPVPPAGTGAAEAAAGPATGVRVEVAPPGIMSTTDAPSFILTSLTPAPNAPHSTKTFSNEYAPDLPPNEGPVAGDDTATCGEDDYVLIDVLANDTDADADTLRIDSWQYEAPHGTITQEPDGRLKYTPFPDFNGTETFTYTASDGQATSSAATVTVTVNPVNDAPRAFDDAYTFGISPFITTFTSNGGGVLGSSGYGVLANDADTDADPLTAELVTQAIYGTVQLDPDGTFTYTPPATAAADLAVAPYYVMTTFTYQADDGNGGASAPATAYIWLKGPTAPGQTDAVPWWSAAAPVAVDDRTPFGDGPATDTVTPNDTDYSVAILTGHPSVGQLTAFDSGGGFTYDPGPVRDDTAFTYVDVSAEGRFSNGAVAQMVKVNLDIWRGQSGKMVRDDNNEEETVGSFTVVNQNDTDGSGERDYKQAGAVQAGGKNVGKDEEDLMRVRVNKPTGFGPNDSLTVTITGGAAQFFLTSLRENNLGKVLTLNAASFMDGGNSLSFRDYWVEVHEPTAAMRDITIEMKYGVATDRLKATGIWATLEMPGGFHSSGNVPGRDIDDKSYIRALARLMARINPQGGVEYVPEFKFGMPDSFYTDAGVNKAGVPILYLTQLLNIVEFEFTTSPAGLEKEPAIVFDVSRTAESKGWRQHVGMAIGDPETVKVLPTYRERANDDGGSGDEDNTPKNSHIYSLDAPGWRLRQAPAEFQQGKYNWDLDGAAGYKQYQRTVHRLNGLEFVRVKLDGAEFIHNPAQPETSNTLEGANKIEPQGSRASELISWYSWSDFTWDGANSKWVRTASVPGQPLRNTVGLGLLDLNQPGL